MPANNLYTLFFIKNSGEQRNFEFIEDENDNDAFASADAILTDHPDIFYYALYKGSVELEYTRS